MYATKQNLIDRFGQTELAQLTDRVAGTTIDDDVIARALADADSLINGYLQTRYTLPLASVPPILEAVAADLTRYYLYEDRVSDIVEQRYNNRVAWLKDISTGKASLGLDGDDETVTPQSGTVDYNANDRVFTKDTLEGF